MAILFKEYGTPKNFDHIAAQLLQNNKYAEAIQLTVDGVITNVYPRKGFEKTIGINTERDTLRKHEASRAKEKNEIYFAGPRPLRMGGIGILGKVPIILNHDLKAICVVLTKLETIKAGLHLNSGTKNKFAFGLLKKTPEGDTVRYFLTAARPSAKSQRVFTEIPEGDWILQASFNSEFPANHFPYAITIMGFLLATLAGIYAHKSILRPYALKRIIEQKTGELTAKEEYFRTLIETSTDAIVLLDETGKVLYQTPSTERISGYTLAEIQSIDGLRLIHPRHREMSQAVFQDLLGNPGGRAIVKFKLRHKDGNYIWAEGTYRNLLNEESVKAIVFNYSDVTERVVAESKLVSTKKQLNERVKELSTIFQVSTILQDNDQNISSAFSRIINILPSGWQYPDVCEVKIKFDGNSYTSEGFKPSPFKQIAEFQLPDNQSGTIEIVYTEEKPPAFEGPFLKEERALLNTLSEMFQVYLNKKAHQEALIRSEARFRGAFEFSAIGMALVSLEGNFQMVNRELSEITGFSEQELLSLNFQKITHPEDLESDLAMVQDLLAGRIDYMRREKRYIHKNGSIIWINLNVALIRDSLGAPSYFVAQIENITARRESELKFRSLVEKSIVGVFIIQNGKFAYVNPWIPEITGYSEAELTRYPFEKFLHPDDIRLVKNLLAENSQEELETVSYELRLVKKNGETIWLEFLGNSTLFEGKTALIGTMVDITGKKAAFDELVKSEANLKAIFDNSQVYFLLLDTSFRVLALNHHFFVNFLAHTGHELQIGEFFLETVRPERKAILQENLETVLKTRQLVNYELTYTQKETPQYLDITISPVITADGVIGICISNIDITKRKILEQERQKMLTELVVRNKKMEEFAAIVSHNLRAPLSNILGLTNLITEGIDRSSEEFILNGIKTSADKMNDIVREMNQILYYQNDFSEQNTTVSLYTLTDELKESYGSEIKVSNARIECDFEEVNELITIRSFLQNIFSNLLSNSLKFRHPDRAPQIKIWADRIPGNVVIHFQDNGIGIDMAKYREQVFGLNKRFHPQISGKGLGLFMVKAQVESLNGTIKVKSDLNEGTIFTITLPVS